MFFEDFSNPKYLANTENWVFPISDNFYDFKGIAHANNNKAGYVSRILPFEHPNDSFNFFVICPENNNDPIVSINFYKKNYELLGTITLGARNDKKEYDIIRDGNKLGTIKMYEYEVHNSTVKCAAHATYTDIAYWYNVEVQNELPYIKIYGL